MGATAVRAAQVASGTLTDVQEATANKDGAANVASLRTLGTSSTQAAAGNDSRFLPSSMANGVIPIGNGSGYTAANITPTANQVLVTNGAGTITLSLPQSIHTAATPQFANLGIGTAATSTSGQILTITNPDTTCYGTNSTCNFSATANTANSGYGGIYVAYAKSNFNYTSAVAVVGLQGTAANFGVTSAVITGMAGVVGVIQHISGSTGTTTNGSALLANSPTVTSGTLTNAIGLKIAKQSQTNVTTGWGIQQADAADVNYFMGKVAFGTSTAPTSAIVIADAGNIAVGSTTGTVLATATTQKLGFWNATPVAQYSATGTSVGFTANSGTAVNDASTFTGNTGSTAYRISDVVRALKLCGIMAA